MKEYIAGYEGHSLQGIRERPKNFNGTSFNDSQSEVYQYRHNPSMLAWYLEEEPTGHYWRCRGASGAVLQKSPCRGLNMSQQFEKYKAE